MDAPYFSTSLPSILHISFFIILTVLLLPPSYCIDDDRFHVECGRPYNCGSIRNIPFPYWGDDRPDYCGHKGYELECFNNDYPVIQFEELKFRVLNFSPSTNNMTIARMDLWDHLCPEKRLTTALNYTLYDYTSTVKNLTLFYGCPRAIPLGNRFECGPWPGAWNNAYFVDDTLPPGINLSEFNQACDATVKVPIFKTSALNKFLVRGATVLPLLKKALKEGFEVEYDQSLLVACSGCQSSGGRCGFNSTSPFVCFCSDGLQFDHTCPPNGRKVGRSKVMIIAFVSLSIVIGVLIIGLYFKRKFTSVNIIQFFEKENLTHQSVETFLKNNGPFSIRRYSYSDIKKMTNLFRDQLGQGGYGCVYKGKLQDGSFVAVKVLKELKGDGKEFINEVMSISRTSHVNIVTLRGFCFEGSKRALIFEFMPNGSLDKFIYRKAQPPKVDHH